MMTTLSQIFRLILLVLLGIFGMAMAIVFMVSTAIAIAVLYVVARVRGRPFGVKAYWTQRQTTRTNYRYTSDKDVIDVQAREIP